MRFHRQATRPPDSKWLDIRSIHLVPVKSYGPRTPLQRRRYCLHVQVGVPEPMLLEALDIQSAEDIIGADRGTKNHLSVSSGRRAHHQGSGRRRNKKRKHQRHIAGKPRDSRRRRRAVSKSHERGRRYAQTRDQDIRSQIRAILLEAQPKMVAIESLHPISMMASVRGTTTAPVQNVAAKRKLNESLAESAIGHVGKLLREEAANLGIPTVSVPPHGTSQTYPRRGPTPEQPREPSGVPVPELRSLRPRRPDCRRHHSQPGLRPALRMVVRSYIGRTDRTNRVARAVIRLRATTTPFRLGAKRVEAGRHRDEFPQEQGTRPKARPPYSNRRPKTPKLRRIQDEPPISGCVLNLSTRSGTTAQSPSPACKHCREITGSAG